MSKVAVVYWSGTGNTEAMAYYVAEGAKAAGAQVDTYTSAEFSKDKAADYPSIAFGCPSMGAEQLEETEFEPMFEEVKTSLSGKRIGLFGSYGWGDGEWMRIWEDDCSTLGCIMAVEPVLANGAPDNTAEEACKALGSVLAK